jgi:hypothetical protein
MSYYPPPYHPGAYYSPVGSSPPSTLTIREAIMQALLGATAVSSVVGTNAYFQAVPESGALPALLLSVKAIDRTHTLGGVSGAALASARIGCASLDLSDCQSVSIAIKALFDGFTGTTVGGFKIWETCLIDEQDLYFDPVDDSGNGTNMIVVDYDFHYREA